MDQDLLQAFLRIVEEHDKRYSERLAAAENMMQLSLTAHRELADRERESFEHRLDQMNHFRETFDRVSQDLVKRKEINALFDMVRELNSRLDILDGRSKGLSFAWTLFTGTVGLVAGIASTIVIISKDLL